MSYSVTTAQFDFKDNYWGGGMKEEHYLVVNRETSFSYYSQADVIGGISLRVDSHRLIISRKVYSLLGWAANVGGFIRIVNFLFFLVFRFRQKQKKWLNTAILSRLYKVQRGEALKGDDLVAMAQESYANREFIVRKKTDRIYDFLRKFICCLRNRLTDDDLVFRKAKAQLAAELDITRVLSTLRLFRLTLKHLVSKEHRNLLRIQATRDLVEVGDGEKESILKAIKGRTLNELLDG